MRILFAVTVFATLFFACMEHSSPREANNLPPSNKTYGLDSSSQKAAEAMRSLFKTIDSSISAESVLHDSFLP